MTTCNVDTSIAATCALDTLGPGKRGFVRSLSGGRAFASRVANLGFTPGAQLEVVQNYGHGPMIVSIRGTRVALGRQEAARVLVEPAQAGAS